MPSAAGSGRLLAGAIHYTLGSLTDDTRDARFAAPVDVPPQASPGDRLVALLGRRPPGLRDCGAWPGAVAGR